jgi:GNAT superfamily N-acetyltransferase
MPTAKGERPAPIDIVIEPLDSNHNRGVFCCVSTPRIQNYCRINARKDHDLYKVRVYVAVAPGSKRVLGFYSLVLKSLVPDDVSELAADKFARVAAVPAIYLAMIGVSDECAGGRIGKRLIGHAIQKALEIAELAGAFALALDALDQEVADLYSELGFELFSAGQLQMFLPLSVARASMVSALGTAAGDSTAAGQSPSILGAVS